MAVIRLHLVPTSLTTSAQSGTAIGTATKSRRKRWWHLCRGKDGGGFHRRRSPVINDARDIKLLTGVQITGNTSAKSAADLYSYFREF